MSLMSNGYKTFPFRGVENTKPYLFHGKFWHRNAVMSAWIVSVYGCLWIGSLTALVALSVQGIFSLMLVSVLYTLATFMLVVVFDLTYSYE